MIILTDTENAFNKIQDPFILKTLNKLGSEENILDMIKRYLQKKKKCTDNITFNGQRMKFPTKIKKMK